MLVVIAVISILAGLTLTGIGGFTSRARDTRRIGDLNNLRNNLEIYATKCGIYPGVTVPGIVGCATVTNWSPSSTSTTFSGVVNAATGGKVPNDPSPTRQYTYFFTTGTANNYILGVALENDNKVLTDTDQIRSTTGFSPPVTDSGKTVVNPGCVYNATTFSYCIGS